jgi:hypothetical protein
VAGVFVPRKAAFGQPFFISRSKRGDLVHQRGEAFYAFGRISCQDAFRKTHYTNFCRFALGMGAGSEVVAHVGDQNNDAN